MAKLTLNDCRIMVTEIAQQHGVFKIGRTSRDLEDRQNEYRKNEDPNWILEEIASSTNLEVVKDFEAKLIHHFLHDADADLKKKCLNEAEGEVGDESETNNTHRLYVAYID
jgi:hypothetical protein